MLYDWKRFDLHFHTIEDKSRKESDLNINEILKKYNEEKVGLIAITNHNTLSEKSRKEVIDIIQKEKYKIKVLWGVELDVYYNREEDKYFHSVIVFDEKKLDYMKQMIENNYPNVNSEKEKALTIKDFVEKFIKEEGFIVVPHFNSKHRSIDNKEIEEQYDTFQIVNKFDFLDGFIKYEDMYKYFVGDGSILHHQQAYKFSDGKTSESVINNIKKLPQTICDLSFVGLQNASLTQKSNISKNIEIISSKVSIENFTLENKKIFLKPGLTTIIGEKGSGKSKLINSIIGIVKNNQKQKNSFSNLKINNNSNEIDSTKVYISKQNDIHELITKAFSYEYKGIKKMVEEPDKFNKKIKTSVDLNMNSFKNKAILLKDNYNKLGTKLKNYYKYLKENDALKDKEKSNIVIKKIIDSIIKHWKSKIFNEKDRNLDEIKSQLKGLYSIYKLVSNSIFDISTKNKLQEALDSFSKYIKNKIGTYNSNLINDLINEYILKFQKIKNSFLKKMQKINPFQFDWEESISKPLDNFNEHKEKNAKKILNISEQDFEESFQINDDQLRKIIKIKVLKNKIIISNVLKDISEKLLNKGEKYNDNFWKIQELNINIKKNIYEENNNIELICDHQNLLKKSPGEQQSIILNKIFKGEYDCYIVDQPEDDMDAQTIKKTIVEEIRKNKEKQYLIVTHDPKIVINAESNLILKAKKVKDFFEYEEFYFKDLNLKTNNISEIIDGDRKYVAERARVYKGVKNGN